MKMEKNTARSIIILLLSFSVCFTTCADKSVPGPDLAQTESVTVDRPGPAHLPQEQPKPYTLGVDDILHISVWGRPDLNKEGPIDSDGAIFVPLAGRVPAEGLTLIEFQKELTARLVKYIRDPQVDVLIKEYRSRRYYVLGHVKQPGILAGRGDTTLVDAVGMAGGLVEDANLAEAFLVRRETVIPIDFRALFRRGDLSQNVLIKKGDLVFIPSSATLRVYVLGEVNTPKVVIMPDGRLFLGEAIAEAGGFREEYAYKSAITVVRGGLADPIVYTVNYRDVLRGRAPDSFVLEPGDIVFVPATGLTKWQRAMDQILPNLSSIIVDAAAIQSLSQ